VSTFGVRRHPELPEGYLPTFDGATGWVNSPLSFSKLRGQVLLVDFWTLTCINWLRTEPYLRGWSRAYRDDGLVVVGAHMPEFSFEHEIDLVRKASVTPGHRVSGRAR
jgi:thiol-disulfide isomerase/thioredoxin